MRSQNKPAFGLRIFFSRLGSLINASFTTADGLVLQQHDPCSSAHLHFGSVPVNKLLMKALAHPTPESTDKASAGQFKAHAPHSMQASRSPIAALLSLIVKTERGQTTSHMPQPMHFCVSSFRVTTFFK
jgi:hypothetical protein